MQVFVEYTDTAGAAKAKSSLHGRKFSGNSVIAVYYPEDKFERGESMEVVKGLWSDGMTSVSAMNFCTLLVKHKYACQHREVKIGHCGKT